ncbi:hypothetical protein Nstercoris_00152 [Nitrosomonas stercoris]|uniref:Type II toxin-antitoxin system RelE/ParE family toxin n=1 Tax=Nitrosomonas stercoris TaxID=1444684 RepID=A0A4Y1YPS5_9PROT|nr:hypothetical protein Nstercoris_00152 [Nitrosomonas stercoris]
MTWHVKLAAAAKDELMALPADMQARFLRISELLEEFGPHKVGLPHVRFVEGKLWEMRLTGRDGIARALYAASTEQTLIVLHVFVKKTRKTPRNAIETALNRLQEIKK